jgi:hypothetical protein
MMAWFNVRKWIDWLGGHLAPVSSETLAWLAVIFLHAATVPSLIAVLTGLSDGMPTVDMVLLTWAGLACLFAQAAVQRNMLQIITISGGFMVQSVLMALIFFK